jgi:hypothetical protein
MKMKRIVLPIVLLLLISLVVFAKESYSQLIFGKGSLHEVPFSSTYSDGLKEGDLIFQTSLSSQSKAIQLATKSKYSHCGIVFKEGDSFYVFEAVQPVKRTPLAEWIARGEKGKFIVKRLKNAEQTLTPDVLQKMKEIGKGFNGKKYDLAFEWTDEKIYCSELIWKIYKRSTGIEIGKLEKLGDFDLSSDQVKRKIKERYGNNIPMEELVISPASIFESELLVTVKSN